MWQLSVVGNTVVAISYFAIAAAIVVPLVQSGQLRTNRLGLATAAIFFSCAVGHGQHAVHLLLPGMTGAVEPGDLRAAVPLHQAAWDLLTGAVGVYYWSLRRSYGALLQGGALFADLREKEAELETNERLLAERASTLAALGASEERFRSAFDAAPVGMGLVSLEPEATGWFLQANPALCHITGRPADDLLQLRVIDLAHPEDHGICRRLLDEMSAGRHSDTVELRLLHAGGDTVWTSASMALVPGDGDRPAHGVLQLADISGRKRAEEVLAHGALHDNLTGLANRRLLIYRLEHALVRARRNGSTVAVLFVDLDRFKAVNDTGGHDLGDELLKAVAGRLSTHLRAADTAARLGGDEFVVVCEDLPSEEQALPIADRILADLARPVQLSGETLNLSASIGIVFSAEEEDAGILLRDADRAMYEAKRQGRGRYVIFDAGLRQAFEKKQAVEIEIRAGLREREFRLFYQPFLDLHTGRITGTEALVRWDHPSRGLLAPGEFLDVAEETGLIGELGEWVLEEACRQLRDWHRTEDPALTMAINVSARQLDAPDFAGLVSRVLADTSVDPGRVCLELTETSLLDASLATVATIDALRALGVRIAMDDFGTGFSSLTHLKRFHVDMVKIDRSFVNGVASNDDDAAIVEAVANLGRTLGLQTVAEGVETVEQLDCVRRFGCELAQGYLFSPPRPPAAIQPMFAAGMPLLATSAS